MKATGKLAKTDRIDAQMARSVIFKYLEGLYYRCRLHSALSYRSAADYEEATMEGAAVA